MSDLRITTIIPWRQRPELEHTLRHNTPFFEAMGSDVVVVNCGGDRDALTKLLGSDGLTSTRQLDLPARRFNRSLALNVGAHEAEAEVLFTLDADILLTRGLRDQAEMCMQRSCFAVLSGLTAVPPREPRFTPPAGSFLRKIVADVHDSYHWADGTVTQVLRARLDCEPDRRAAPGIMLIPKPHLLKVGGYRSDLAGWGWEDIDVQVRLLRQGIACVHADEEIQHLEHGDDKRDLDGPMAIAENANRSRVWDAYCAGNFLGTYEADVRTWRSANSRTALV